MKGKNLLLIGILLIIGGIIWFGLNSKTQTGLVNPQTLQVFTKPTPTPTPVPPQAPKTFQFDRSTDLKKELNSINPQVLDSDFAE